MNNLKAAPIGLYRQIDNCQFDGTEDPHEEIDIFYINQDVENIPSLKFLAC